MISLSNNSCQKIDHQKIRLQLYTYANDQVNSKILWQAKNKAYFGIRDHLNTWQINNHLYRHLYDYYHVQSFFYHDHSLLLS